MPVPTLISQLSTTASLNSPDGAVDTPSSIDDYQRAHAAFIAQLYAATQNKPSFSVYKTSNQTGIANTTDTLVTWDVEEFDTNNSFASNRFTPKVEGNYLLNAHLLWVTGVDQSPYVIMIYKNGSLYKATRDSFSGSTSTLGNLPQNQITEIVKANGTTDYFEIYVWQGTGSSQTLAGSSTNSVFSGVLL